MSCEHENEFKGLADLKVRTDLVGENYFADNKACADTIK